MSCVNTANPEFKAQAKRLNISEGHLRNIVHQFQNQKGNEDSFPSDAYVLSKLQKAPNIVTNEAQQRLWWMNYSSPTLCESMNEVDAYINDASKYFNPDSVIVKELPNGKYEVSVGTPAKSVNGIVTSYRATPLKTQYKGKLIFAQSGTGKSYIADNVNVIDSDVILGEVLGVAPEFTTLVFQALSSSDKALFSEQYNKKIDEYLSKGKTVLTASNNLLDKANVVIYNSSAEEAAKRSSSSDRVGSNNFTNIEYHQRTLDNISNSLSHNKRESVQLKDNEHLADVLLTDKSYKVNRVDTPVAKDLKTACTSFLNSFGIDVHTLEDYNSDVPLFDALNRVVNATSDTQLSEATGYAVAFMMQHNPIVKELISMMHANPKSIRRAFKRNSDAKFSMSDREYRALNKERYLKEIGKDIATELNKLYGKEDLNLSNNWLKQIWKAITEFFNTINPSGIRNIDRLSSYTSKIAQAISKNQKSVVSPRSSKPGTISKSIEDMPIIVDVQHAFREHPYEASIVKTLNNEGAYLAGSAAVASQGTLYRPSENPLHDLDFVYVGKTKEEIQSTLNRLYPNNIFIRTINDDGELTQTFLILDRPFISRRPISGIGVQELVDKNTGEKLGTWIGSDLILNEGVQGKFLDFFTGKDAMKYGSKTVDINGESITFSAAENAFNAKLTWQRDKDIWDYNNYVPYTNSYVEEDNTRFDLAKPVTLKQKAIQADLAKIQVNEWNLPEDVLHIVESKLADYMSKKDGKVQDVEVSNYFGNENTTTAKDILTYINKNSTDTAVKELASYVLKNLGNNKDVKVSFSNNKNLRGRYHSGTHSVSIYTASLTGNTTAEALNNMEQTVIHEITHAITVKALEQSAEARREILSIYKEFLELENQYGIKLGYASKNVKEFVAEFLGRKAFREALMALPSKSENLTIGKKILNFIKSLLGINPKNTFFDRVDEVISKVLDASNSRQWDNIENEDNNDELPNVTSSLIYSNGSNHYEYKETLGGKRNVIKESPSSRSNASAIKAYAKEDNTFYEGIMITDDYGNPTNNYKWTEIPVANIDAKIVASLDELQDYTPKVTETTNDNSTIYINGTEGFSYGIKEGQTIDLSSVPESWKGVTKSFTIASIDNSNGTIKVQYNQEDGTSVTRERTFTQVADALTDIGYEDTNVSQEENKNTDGVVTNTTNEENTEINNETLIDATLPDTESKQESKDVPEAKEQVEVHSAYKEQSADIIKQLAAIRKDNIISEQEVRHLAEQTMYFISDMISQLQEDATNLLDSFGFSGKTAEEKAKIVNKLQGMSRIEVAKFIGADNLLEACRNQLYVNNSEFDNPYREDIDDIMDKGQLLYDNFNALVRVGAETFLKTEGFGIVAVDGKMDFTDEVNADNDNFNDSNESSDVKEEEGSEQEHWQIESRTRDILDNATSKVMQAITQCYDLVKLDTTSDNIKREGDRYLNTKTGFYYEEVGDGVFKKISNFGVQERLGAKEVTAQILNWSRGSITYEDMIAKLQEKAENNPWVNQLLDKLVIVPGQKNPNADLQSQFWSVFCKHFQPYSVVVKEDGKYKTIQVNEHPAQSEAMRAISTQIRIGEHPMFTKNGVNQAQFAKFKEAVNSLHSLIYVHNSNKTNKLAELNKDDVAQNIWYAAQCLGYYVTPDIINAALSSDKAMLDMEKYLSYIVKSVEKELGNKEYEPLKFKDNPNGIYGNLRNFLSPITDIFDDIAVSSVYDSGKMYQSYVQPSYMTKMMNKFRLDSAEFKQFLEDEYGYTEWFKDKTGWRNQWLDTLSKMSPDERTKIFRHKVQLNFNKKNYMRDMTDAEYTLSLLTEYFSNKGTDKSTQIPAWYRVPMLSNKPSSEFIQFYRYHGDFSKGSNSEAKRTLVDGFKMVFDQEVSRIQTCEMRAEQIQNKDAFIKSFDKNGKKFCFLDFCNDYLFNKDSEYYRNDLATLLRKKLDAKELSPEEELALNEGVRNIIVDALDRRADQIIEKWRSEGILDAVSSIENMEGFKAPVKKTLKEINELFEREEDKYTQEQLDEINAKAEIDATRKFENQFREFIWNDAFAAMNILQLTVTDVAYYKDAVDLQKRLAQIHAPGVRGNVSATDYNGNRVTDGKERTFYLTDFDKVQSNIIDNVNIVFDKKIANATTEEEKEGYRALKDSLTRPPKGDDKGGAFWNINLADAQGYSCPTSYRKKAFIFGMWSTKAEEAYQKIIAGDKTSYSELQQAFQVLKPFVYSQVSKPSNAENAPISNLKVGIQNKNSEYLLILADAILQGEETGRPNLLRAIYKVMEESAESDNTKGIDTVQFESTVKAGLMGKIDLTDCYDIENGEEVAYQRMKSAIYKQTETPYTADNGEQRTKMVSSYDETYVHEIPFEDYCIQQPVPEHFKEHQQAHGSQIRYIIASDLDSYYDGEPVTYDFYDSAVLDENGNATLKKLTSEEFKQEYENTIAENIQESLSELATELCLDENYSGKNRNIALSRILQKEILSSPRYGIDLLEACSVDDNGEFNIPLGDPIQSKRVEQLINSIIKNRVNKQKIAGGPVVQVTNFGTSKRLSIKFKDKNGNILLTKEEFAKKAPDNGKSYDIDKAYNQYLKDNQSGIAYFEVFAPIASNEMFKQFEKEDGTIDIGEVEKVNPDLLKMIGYRIPSEDKYSGAPLKIVGFLPREAGEAIMMPADITLLTGSDFDVDKMYLMRKEIMISKRSNLSESANPTEAEKDYIKHNKTSIRKVLRESVNVKTTQEERDKIAKDVKDTFDVDRRQAKRRYDAAIAKEDEREELANDASDNAEFSKDTDKNLEIQDKQADKIEKNANRRRENITKRYEAALASIDAQEEAEISKQIQRLEDKKANDIIDEFLNVGRHQKSSMDNAVMSKLRDAYLKYMYHSVEDIQGRIYRNNKIVDMTWAVLTNRSQADKVLNPGGYDSLKKTAYLIQAYKLNPEMGYNQLKKMSLDKLQDLCSAKQKMNLAFIDDHIQFYKQNNAASTILGMFAVQKVAHAVLEGNGYKVDVNDACKLPMIPERDDKGNILVNEQGNPVLKDGEFTIAGVRFSGMMELDPTTDFLNQSISKTLGSDVAGAADAGKDPFFNIINVNSQTTGILTTLTRLGVPFDTSALLLSQGVLTDSLAECNKRNINGYANLSQIIQEKIDALNKEYGFNAIDNKINGEELTEDELVAGLINPTPQIQYKTLMALQNVMKISNAIKGITFITRFNSISSAVGPLAIDNLIIEHKVKQFNRDDSFIYDANGERVGAFDVLDRHPILKEFSHTIGMARTLLEDMPSNSNQFRSILDSIELDFNKSFQDKFYRDRKLLSQLSDFYQAYMLEASGAPKKILKDAGINEKFGTLKYFIQQFPIDYFRGNAKERFPNNALIQAIKIDSTKDGKPFLKVDITGLDAQQKAKLGSAWTDLYNDKEHGGDKLSTMLFLYNYYRTGVAFSPKTFMSLIPAYVKAQMSAYIDTYKSFPKVYSDNVIDQFVRNNWDNRKIVPKLTPKDIQFTIKDNTITITKEELVERYKNTPYFRITLNNIDTLFRMVGEATDKSIVYEKIDPLGNNGEYLEISQDDITKSMSETVVAKEQPTETEIREQAEQEIAEPEYVVEDPLITEEDGRKVVQIFQVGKYDTQEKSIERIKAFRDREDKGKYESQMKQFMQKRADTLGFQADMDKIEELYNKYC